MSDLCSVSMTCRSDRCDLAVQTDGVLLKIRFRSTCQRGLGHIWKKIQCVFFRLSGVDQIRSHISKKKKKHAISLLSSLNVYCGEMDRKFNSGIQKQTFNNHKNPMFSTTLWPYMIFSCHYPYPLFALLLWLISDIIVLSSFKIYSKTH